MVTLKDIAQYTQLSPSTVSIVLKGNGDARKIKKKLKRLFSRLQKSWAINQMSRHEFYAEAVPTV